MSQTNWTEMTAAYVLGSLEPEERASFEERLASDPALELDLASYREVMGALAAAPPLHAPPTDLKERILVEARGGQAASPRSLTQEPRRGSGGRWTTVPWMLAAAGVVLSLGLGIVYQGTRTENGALRVAYEQAEAENASLRVAYERAASDVEARDSLLATFLGPDVRTATLAATGRPPSARMFWNTTAGSVVMAAFDLPPAEAGRIYQLWGIVTGLDPVSFGTFQTAADGTAIFRSQVPEGIEFELGAVTDEPTGGSPQPTTTPFLVGDLSSG